MPCSPRYGTALVTPRKTPAVSVHNNEEFRITLRESQDTLDAIRAGEVDAVVMRTTDGDQLFTANGADRPYRLFVEGMAEGAMSVMSDGTILSANSRMIDMGAVSLSSLVGTPIKRLFTDESLPTLRTMLQAKEPTIVPVEMMMHVGDGPDLAVSLTASSLDLDGLAVTCILVTDISERRRAQEAQRFHTTLLGAAIESIVVTDLDGCVTFVNSSAERLYGWSSKEMLGRHFADILPIESAAGSDTFVNMADVRAGDTWAGEYRAQHSSGRWIPVFGSFTPVYGVAGELIAVIGIASDVTERVRAEAALEVNERWFRSLIQHSSDIILVIDANGVMRYLSPSGLSVLGYASIDLIGRTLAEFVHPEDLLVKHSAIAEASALELGGAAKVVRYRFRHASGEWRWLETIGTNLLEDSAVRGIVINGRDVSDNVHITRALKTLRRANEVVTRADSEATLLSQLCATIVESGYELAWIGYVAQSGRVASSADGQDRVALVGHVNVVSAAGELAYLNEPDVSWSTDEYRCGPMASAINSGATHVVNNIPGALNSRVWRVRAEAYCFQSACALPLIVDGVVIGAVNIYSFVPGAFDARSSQTLEELTANLAYGISRHRERSQLAERESLLREAEKLAHVGHWRWTIGTRRIEFLADGILTIFGVTREESPDTLEAMLAFVPEGERDEVAAQLDRAASGESAEWQNTIVRADQSVRRIRTRTSISRDAQGRIESVVGACLDRTEQALTTEELIFQAQLLDNAGEAIVGSNERGEVTYWNRAAESFFGWTSAEAMGRTVTEVMPSDITVDQVVESKATIESGGTWQGELVVRRRDETLVEVSVTDTPSYDGRGKSIGTIRVASDSSARRALEQRLGQAQRLESLGLLAGGIAHDFNNLLTVILNCGTFIERDGADTERRYAHQIVTAGESAARLTRQLLTFARREQTRVERLDLKQVAIDIQELLTRTIGEHILLELRTGPPVTVDIDRGQLEQVLVNLAINASDAMPRGGKVIIEIGVVELDETYSKLHPDVEPGLYGQIEVSDTGHGMSPEVLTHAFDPFYTTKSVNGGTGLGLATVYGIAKSAHGQVNLYSEVGVGTTVRVYLPLFEVHDETQPAPPESVAPLPRGATILIVEDKDDVREVTRDILRHGGFIALEASSAAEAITLADTHAFDLLLTDVVMPEMSGPALVEKLIATRPGLPVVFMSGYSADFLGTRGTLDADVTLVQKPFTETALLLAVGEALERISPISPITEISATEVTGKSTTSAECSG
jgi:PAS domain S-box-containing protein